MPNSVHRFPVPAAKKPSWAEVKADLVVSCRVERKPQRSFVDMIKEYSAAFPTTQPFITTPQPSIYLRSEPRPATSVDDEMKVPPTPRETSRSDEDGSNLAPDSTRPRYIYKPTPRATNDVLGRDRRQRGVTQPPSGPNRPRSREQREREQQDHECQKLQDKIAHDTRQAEVLAQFEAARTADTADPHPTEMVSTRGEERRERMRQAKERERRRKLNGDVEVTGEEPQTPGTFTTSGVENRRSEETTDKR